METLEVKLGGRTYPLTLSPEEVDIVRQSAEAVEAQIAQLKSQYAITDRIDLMAMAALQIAVQSRSGGTSSPPPSGSSDPWPKERVDDLLQQAGLNRQKIQETNSQFARIRGNLRGLLSGLTNAETLIGRVGTRQRMEAIVLTFRR